MQTDAISRLQNTSSTVKTPSPLGNQGYHSNMGQLDNIFQSVKRQIDQWGENAKWKIDLVLLDKPQPQQSNSLHPLLSPQHLHPNVITTPSGGGDSKSTYSLPISSTIEFPWDYISPPRNESEHDSEDLQQKLRESIERQHYLENIIWSQSDQIKSMKESLPQEDKIINTMKSIFLMSQSEQKMQYLVETNILKRDTDTLTKKLQKSASILYEIERIELPNEDTILDKETLLDDRKLLMRKLHLAELRLSARDAEIEYLHELVNNLRSQSSTNTSSNSTTSPKPQFQKKMRKGPPYLFQQQYSPRSSEIRSEQHPLSGLESLGIVADQMLSDPEFESSSSNVGASEKRLRSRLDDRRSQRSIDSAATLLAMPQLMTSTKVDPRIPTDFEQIPKKPRSTYTRWTSDEDERLINAVKKYGYSNWEACSRDVHGRSNIQCRNRWIRHLEHRFTEDNASTSSPISDARQSPSIAALLNSDESSYNYSPRSTPRQLQNTSQGDSSYYTPTYRPPSPIATPKGKRRSAETLHTKW